MVEYLVIGKEYLNYVSKKTNKQVTGYNLHLQYDDHKVEGSAVLKEFVSEEVGKDVKISDSIKLLYNKYGKIAQIDIIS